MIPGAPYSRNAVLFHNMHDAIPDPVAFGLPLDSDLLGLFNHNMLKLHQSGNLDFLRRAMASRRPEDDACGCRAVVEEEARPLGRRV